MHKLVHNLTMIVVLYHLLVGCCGHHAHAADAEIFQVAESSTILSDEQDDHGDHCTCDDQPGGQPGSDGPPRGCQHGHCVFVVPTDGAVRVVLQADLSASPVPMLAAALLTPPAAQACEFPWHSYIAPVRLHLLNQILLI